MQITFSPQLWGNPPALAALSVSGSVLMVNGVAIDLASYDAEAAPSEWIVGQPVQSDGTWQVTVLLPIGTDAGEAARFPALVSVEAGAVPVPA